MKKIVSFVDEDGDFIGPWHQIEGLDPPEINQLVTLSQDGLTDVLYRVADVRHMLHRSLDGDFSQMIDIVLTKVEAKN